MATLNIVKKCKIPSCRKENRAGGLCNMHYVRKLRGLPLDVDVLKPGPKVKQVACTLDSCSREYYARGLCRMHYERNRKGDVDLEREMYVRDSSKIKEKDPCLAPDCEREVSARGYCTAHYMQWLQRREIAPIQVREKLLTETGRVCKNCRRDLPMSDYYLRSCKIRYQNDCKMCVNARSSIRSYEKGSTKNRPDWAYNHMAWADSQNNLKGDKIEV